VAPSVMPVMLIFGAFEIFAAFAGSVSPGFNHLAPEEHDVVPTRARQTTARTTTLRMSTWSRDGRR